jgi:hypothetical protein
MSNTENDHLTSQLNNLEKKGFTDQLVFENGQLKNLSNHLKYSVNQIVHSSEYRFEGMTNPSDMSILFAIEFDDGSKGTLAAPYGSQGDADLFAFMNKVKD